MSGVADMLNAHVGQIDNRTIATALPKIRHNFAHATSLDSRTNPSPCEIQVTVTCRWTGCSELGSRRTDTALEIRWWSRRGNQHYCRTFGRLAGIALPFGTNLSMYEDHDDSRARWKERVIWHGDSLSLELRCSRMRRSRVADPPVDSSFGGLSILRRQSPALEKLGLEERREHMRRIERLGHYSSCQRTHTPDKSAGCRKVPSCFFTAFVLISRCILSRHMRSGTAVID